jgi:quinol monooxygenase YgiN
MPYIRISIARPNKGAEKRFEEVMRELTAAVTAQEGCQAAYVLKPHDESGEIARVTIYADEHAAEQSANSDRILALRSEMHRLCQTGHTERAFFSI